MVVQFHKITGIKVEKKNTGAYNAKGDRERERILDEEMTQLEGFQLKSELGAVSRRFGDYSCVDCANSTNLSQTFLSLLKKELFVVVGQDLTRELSRAFCQISCGAACSIPQAAEFPDFLRQIGPLDSKYHLI